MQYDLKTWPDPFEAVWTGLKRYEVRKDDRKFAVGDKLVLKEFVPCEECHGTGRVHDGYMDWFDCGCAKPHGKYTGRAIKAKVTYKTTGGEWGLPAELCVLSIKTIGRIKARRSRKAA